MVEPERLEADFDQEHDCRADVSFGDVGFGCPEDTLATDIARRCVSVRSLKGQAGMLTALPPRVITTYLHANNPR